MKNILIKTLFVCLAILPTVVYSGTANDIPSCYKANKLSNNSSSDYELFVMVDQTTIFDSKLKSAIKENVRRLVKPGASFVVADFSSFSQGRYVEVLSAGTLEKTISDDERQDISVKLLRNFDNCMHGQLNYGMKIAANALNTALGGSSSDLARSDVITSLKEFSGRVKSSTVKNKIVLIASDMLENSSITSFYSKQMLRQIKPEEELKLVEKNGGFGDFGDAKIYVIGAGLLAEDAKQAKGVYRSPQSMQALSSFWKTWFQKSNGELVEFGQPALLNPISF